MIINNNALLIKHQLLLSLIKLFFENKLEEGIDRIPWNMTSAEDYKPIRCCVFHDRVLLKIRLIAQLGFSVEDYEEAGVSLAVYARKALERDNVTGPVLTVLDDACNACVKTQFMVTNACQGCLARPCFMNCPRKAISIVEGRSIIDGAKCVNCGICQRVCPYHAIIKIPVPCEESCPVHAIAKDAHGKERIDYSKCIFCGNCMRECPFGAMMDKCQILDVLAAQKRGRKIAVFFAPAVAGQFKATLGRFIGALRQAGFDAVYEVALGADITAHNEAAEFIERMEKGEPFMTTSCCPAYIEVVRKHINELENRISSTRTPMHYTAAIAQQEHPDYLRVFIGPCLAKRQEGLDDPLVDYVLSAEEINALFAALNIDPAQAEEAEIPHPAKAGGRGFPLSGGVAAAIKRHLKDDSHFHPETVNGLGKEGIAMLKAWGRGEHTGNILEVMACPGGCVSGPMVIANPKTAANQLRKIAEEGADKDERDRV